MGIADVLDVAGVCKVRATFLHVCSCYLTLPRPALWEVP